MLKKFFCIGLIIVSICLCGCTNLSLQGHYPSNSEKEIAGKNTDGIILPKAELSDIASEKCINELPDNNFDIFEVLNHNYYGVKSVKTDHDMLGYEYFLVNYNNNTKIPLNYQSGTKDWTVGSGSSVVMENRYRYEWQSYTTEMSGEPLQDVRLIRTDGKTGNVMIIDKVKQRSPFIYLCKIDEKHFLSFGITQAPSTKTEYAVISSASIYDNKGKKRDIIKERYENNESWTDSEGILIEMFAVNNGEIYGYGRRNINKEYKHFLYHFDLSGKLIEEETLDGFGDIIGSEQPVDFRYVGDYIAFRTYESLNNYICRKNGNSVELIMKGIDGQVQYDVLDKYILFMEKNVDMYTDRLKNIDCPLYILDTLSDSVKAVILNIPVKNPYFDVLSSLSDNSVILSYCENTYDPANKHQFLIDYKTIENIMN